MAVKRWLEYETSTGRVCGTYIADAPPPVRTGRAFVDVTDMPDAERAVGYDAGSGALAMPREAPKTLSKADVIGALSPVQWAEMQRYHPEATGTSASGTPYNDPDVFWAISVFNAATKDFVLTDPRIASILGMLVQKGVLSAQDVTAL